MCIIKNVDNVDNFVEKIICNRRQKPKKPGMPVKTA